MPGFGHHGDLDGPLVGAVHHTQCPQHGQVAGQMKCFVLLLCRYARGDVIDAEPGRMTERGQQRGSSTLDRPRRSADRGARRVRPATAPPGGRTGRGRRARPPHRGRAGRRVGRLRPGRRGEAGVGGVAARRRRRSLWRLTCRCHAPCGRSCGYGPPAAREAARGDAAPSMVICRGPASRSASSHTGETRRTPHPGRSPPWPLYGAYGILPWFSAGTQTALICRADCR